MRPEQLLGREQLLQWYWVGGGELVWGYRHVMLCMGYGPGRDWVRG